MKRFVLCGLIFVLLSTIVLADELKIKDIDAIVNGDIISDIDENQKDLEVKSGDRVDLIIEFENEHRPSTNIDIQVLDLFVSLDDFNLVSESMNFDIDAGEEVTKRVTFSVPNLEGNVYTLKIEVEGKDDDNHIQEDVKFVNLILKNDKSVFVERIKKSSSPITTASTSEVTVRFADNNLKTENSSSIPYLWISFVSFIIFIIILILILLMHKINK